MTFELNETVETQDIAVVLENQSGEFEITSPNGDRLLATCLSGGSLVSLRQQSDEPGIRLWRVRKITQF
jgi:hypothetical protein